MREYERRETIYFVIKINIFEMFMYIFKKNITSNDTSHIQMGVLMLRSSNACVFDVEITFLYELRTLIRILCINIKITFFVRTRIQMCVM